MADPEVAVNIQAQGAGGIVRPLYQERAMKCYVVTDSELRSMSLANGLMVIFFSLATTCLGFGINIAKDSLMAPELAPAAKFLTEFIQPACYWAAAIFALCGLWAYFWRRSAVAMIKRESGDKEAAFALAETWRVWWRGPTPPPA